jgi:hypothetical protein
MSGRRRTFLAIVSWLWVGVPFLYGFDQLLVKVPALFGN